MCHNAVGSNTFLHVQQALSMMCAEAHNLSQNQRTHKAFFMCSILYTFDGSL